MKPTSSAFNIDFGCCVRFGSNEVNVLYRLRSSTAAAKGVPPDLGSSGTAVLGVLLADFSHPAMSAFGDGPKLIWGEADIFDEGTCGLRTFTVAEKFPDKSGLKSTWLATRKANILSFSAAGRSNSFTQGKAAMAMARQSTNSFLYWAEMSRAFCLYTSLSCKIMQVPTCASLMAI